MPLNIANLNQDLLDLFTSPPASFEACAESWANAVGTYLEGITQLQTLPDLSAVTEMFKVTLQSIFESNTKLGIGATTAAQMEGAFASMGALVSLQITSTGLYVSTPPVDLVGFDSLFSTAQELNSTAAANFAAAIDAWARTGSTTLIASPFTVSLWV